jgi:hypothetical protein
VPVLREGERRAAMDVARELVEHDDERQQRLGGGAPRLELARRRRGVRGAEALADERIELLVLAEPLGARRAARLEGPEPEVEDLYGQRWCSQRFTSMETWAMDSMPSSRRR